MTTSYGIVFISNLYLDSEFHNLSTLLMGPRPGFRIFEQYKLSIDGSELFSNFTITNRQVSSDWLTYCLRLFIYHFTYCLISTSHSSFLLLFLFLLDREYYN